jgi:hypothetical protein
MSLDLNLPAAEDEEEDPFGGLPHGQDHPPPVGGNLMGDAHRVASLDFNMAATQA